MQLIPVRRRPRSSGGTWVKTPSPGSGDKLGDNGWSKALQNGNTPKEGYAYIQHKTPEITIYKPRNVIHIVQGGNVGPLYEYGEGIYSTTIENHYVRSGMASVDDLDIDKVVLIMPVGMELDVSAGISLSGDGVPAGSTATVLKTDTVNEEVGGTTYRVQRVVVLVDRTIPGNTDRTTSLVLSYKLKVVNLNLLKDRYGDLTYFSRESPIKASTYYNPETTGVWNSPSTTKVEENGTTGNWWSWDKDASTAGKNCLYTWMQVELRQKRINPGIQLVPGVYNETTRQFTEKTEFDNLGSPYIDWKVTVLNGTDSPFSMKNATAAVVLPVGVTYNPNTSAYLAGVKPTGVYENADGQQVLYWILNEATLRVIDSSIVSDDGGLKAGYPLTLVFRTTGVTSAFGSQTAFAYLIPSNNDYFNTDNAPPPGGYGEVVDTDSLLSLMKDRLYDPTKKTDIASAADRAVFNSGAINLRMPAISVEVEKAVHGSDDAFSSSSRPTPIDIGRGEIVDFDFTLVNSGDQNTNPFTYIAVYDALPAVGDTYLKMNKHRSSKFPLEMVWGENDNPAGAFNVYLDGELVTTDRYEVYFSDSTESSDVAWKNKTDWVEASAWNAGSSTPAAYKIVFDNTVTVPARQTLSVTWQMKMVDDPDPDLIGSYAYNSAAIYFIQRAGNNVDYNYFLEPAKCGVRYVGDTDLSLDFTKTYLNMLALSGRGEFTFRVEKYNPQFGEWQLVDLQQADLSAGTVVRAGHFSVLVASGGGSQRLTISNLDEGRYRITEIDIIPGMQVASSNSEIYLNAGNTGARVIYYNWVVDPYPPLEPETPPVTPPPGGGGGAVVEPPEVTPPDETPPEVEPPTEIPDPIIPAAGGDAWSLVNLICSILGIIEMLILVVEFIVRKVKKDQRRKDQQNRKYLFKSSEDEEKESTLLKVLSVIVSVLPGILFYILEWFHGKMVLFTVWSWIIVPVFIASVIITIIEHRTREEREEE